MARNSRLTINSREMVLEVNLALAIGVNEALVLRQLYWLISIYEGSHAHERASDGRYWVQATLGELQERHFPFWSERTLQRILQRLRDLGYLLIQEPSPGAKMGSKYTINRDKVEAFSPTSGRRKTTSVDATTAEMEAEEPSEAQTLGVTDCHPIEENWGDNLSGVGVTICHPTQGTTGDDLSPQTGDRLSPHLSLLYKTSCSLDSVRQQQQENAQEEVRESETETFPKGEDVVVVFGLLTDRETDYALSPESARRVIAAAGTEVCRRQIGWLPFRPLPPRGSRAGQLLKSIEQDWQEPPAAKQRRQEAHRRSLKAEAEQAAAVQREAAQASAEAMSREIEAFEAGLTPEEKAQLEAEARERLSPIWRKKYDEARAVQVPLSAMLEPVWVSARQFVLREWMERTVQQ